MNWLCAVLTIFFFLFYHQQPLEIELKRQSCGQDGTRVYEQDAFDEQLLRFASAVIPFVCVRV